jgi:predicted Zn-dependent protease
MRASSRLPCLAVGALTLAAALADPVAAGEPPFYTGGTPDLPDIGESASAAFTPAQEKRLGQAFMRSVRSTGKVLADPLITDYLQSLGKRLAARADSGAQAFSFFVVDDPSVNAFAGPGGHIGVHTGLILTTESENELAAVLAHEIAHVSQKHLLRAFEATSALTIPQAAVLLAAVILGTAAGGAAGIAAALGGQAALLQSQINFTRGNEQEADRVGMQILAQAAFDPRAMPSFFERMGRSGQAYATQLPEFLRTHPVTVSRIADAQGRAESYPYRQRPDDLRYHLARAALQARQPRAADEAVGNARASLRQGRHASEAAERYGLALALMRARDYEGARREIDRLRGADPSRIEYVVTSARIHAASGSPERGLAELEQALKANGASYPLRLEYAEAALAADKPARAREVIEPLVRSRPDQPEVMRLMARASATSGHTAVGHRYQGEYYYLTGAVDSAVQQLEIALRDPGLDFQQSSMVDARLRELREEAADLKKEKRRTER